MFFIQSAAVISLGCSKNTVDTEIMLYQLKKEYNITNDFSNADILIVNTCGFINDAKEESINTIFELAKLKNNENKLLIVTGCLAQRYAQQLLDDIPEIDIVMGVEQYLNILPAIKRAKQGERFHMIERIPIALNGKRVLTTPSYTAFVKIAEGCNNRCSFCAIPFIRGKYRSVPMEKVEEEVRHFVAKGVKEIVLIAEDTTRYGIDLYKKPSLYPLLERLVKIEGLKWLRVLYCYPDTLSRDLIDLMAESPNICKYLDIPLQHASNALLKSMNRRGTNADFTDLINYARQRGFTIRTTFIVGFPGETEEQFEELLNYTKNIAFDRMGAFAYSPEEGTKGAQMPNQVPEDIKRKRLSELMELQAEISLQNNKKRVGKEYTVLVRGLMDDGYIHARSQSEAPEVDGEILLPNIVGVKAGDMREVIITSADVYDLYAEWK